AQKQLDKLLAKAKAGRVRARGVLYEGTAADAITRAARARHARLIVMGTHGRTGLTRLLMGSVAERGVGAAPGPALAVRGRGRRQVRSRRGRPRPLGHADEPAGRGIERDALASYLARVLGGRVEVLDVRRLGGGEPGSDDPKGFGYGVPLEVECLVDGRPRAF